MKRRQRYERGLRIDPLQPDDLVVPARSPDELTNLKPRWHDPRRPFTVDSALNWGTYRIRDPDGLLLPRAFHRDRLKRVRRGGEGVSRSES
jgi:hypothetical protein